MRNRARPFRSRSVRAREAFYVVPQCSRDGKKLYYAANLPQMNALKIVERDLGSGAEQELYRRTDSNRWGEVISPDGRNIAALASDQAHVRTPTLLLIPAGGGEPRELLRVNEPQRLGMPLTWTPDGQSVIAPFFADNSGRRGYWLIHLTGGQPQTLEIDTGALFATEFRTHPDGRQVAYLAGERKFEVLALENFLPPAKSVK